MTKLVSVFVLSFVCIGLCGCKFSLKDASAAIGELLCETPKN